MRGKKGNINSSIGTIPLWTNFMYKIPYTSERKDSRENTMRTFKTDSLNNPFIISMNNQSKWNGKLWQLVILIGLIEATTENSQEKVSQWKNKILV